MGAIFRVNGMFSDGMVLQRDAEVPIWGEGAEGLRIAVECGGKRAEAVVEEGRWKAVLPPFDAGGPYELTITAGKEKAVYRDVHFGEVWLAGGQSNMEWRLRDTVGAKEDIAASGNPLIRYYDFPKTAFADGKEQTAVWKVSSPANAGLFSAVPYHFARELQASLNVPVGIVGCNRGGTSASCWMAPSYLEADPGLRTYLEEYAEFEKSLDMGAYEERHRLYWEAEAEFWRKNPEGLTGNDLSDYPWPPPLGPKSYQRPCGLYEHMLVKAAPYAIRGFIYYQGENDVNKPVLYYKLMEALIRNWRDVWGKPDLPFLFVQLPNFGFNGQPDGDNWPMLRESQWMVAEDVPNTGLAVILDCGEKDDIHPRNKKPVGERLALVARERVYGEAVDSSGPLFREMRVEGSRAVLRFDHAVEGLQARGGELAGFEIAGEDGRFVPARAAISGADAVSVWSGEVSSPTAVRYGWKNYTDGNLFSGAGLPAGPFRTRRTGR